MQLWEICNNSLNDFNKLLEWQNLILYIFYQIPALVDNRLKIGYISPSLILHPIKVKN
jgi:hypothetical protein